MINESNKKGLIVSFGKSSNAIISKYLDNVDKQQFVLVEDSGNQKWSNQINEENFLDYNYEKLLSEVSSVKLFIDIKSIEVYKIALHFCRVCGIVRKINYQLCVFYSGNDTNIKQFLDYFETQPCSFVNLDNERSVYYFIEDNIKIINGINE